MGVERIRMSGFCGWIGDVTDEAQARHTLARMAKGLRNATAPSMHKNTGANCGLLIGGALQEVHFCAADDIWVAIVGYPDWATAADRDSARIRGHAEVAADAYRASGDTFLKGSSTPQVEFCPAYGHRLDRR
jgi:hypothetical protein